MVLWTHCRHKEDSVTYPVMSQVIYLFILKLSNSPPRPLLKRISIKVPLSYYFKDKYLQTGGLKAGQFDINIIFA